MAATATGVVVGLGWREEADRRPRALYQVLRFRDGKVVDIEDHRDRAAALRALSR